MADLDDFIRSSIADYSREEMIKALERKGDEVDLKMRSARSRAQRIRRGMAKAQLHSRESTASTDVDKIERILFFLRVQRFADGATDDERALCDYLAEKLRAKNEW